MEPLLFKDLNKKGKFSLPREDQHLEYKTAAWKLPESFWETVSAFANTDGGTIILGVSEDKQNHSYQVEGVDNPIDLRTELFNLNNNSQCISRPMITDEDVQVVDCLGKKLIQVVVRPEQYNRRPLKAGKYAYVRADDGDRQASEDQLKYFLVERQSQIDIRLLPHYDMQDLNQNDLKNYQEIAQKNTKVKLTDDLAEFAYDFGAFRRERTGQNAGQRCLTEGGLLFFGGFNSITDRFPRFQLDYLRYAGDGDTDWIDRVSSGDMNFPELNIFSFYQTVLPKLLAGVDDKYAQDEQLTRGSYYADLQLAAKEALVNSLMHAYYDGLVAVKVVDRPSYFEFSNPGDMRVSRESFLRGQNSVIRNSEIAILFRRIGISEKAASGGPRILEATRKNHLMPPEITVNHDLNTTTVRIWKVERVPIAQQGLDLDDAEAFIAEFADSHKRFNFPELMAATRGEYGSASKLRKRLNNLIDRGLVASFGQGRARTYAVARTTDELQAERIMRLKSMEKKL